MNEDLNLVHTALAELVARCWKRYGPYYVAGQNGSRRLPGGRRRADQVNVRGAARVCPAGPTADSLEQALALHLLWQQKRHVRSALVTSINVSG